MGALASALILTVVATVLPGNATAAASATVVRQGPIDRPKIALTFDDSYNPAQALAFIDVLRHYDVPTTMFVLGVYVTACPSPTQAIAARGVRGRALSRPAAGLARRGGRIPPGRPPPDEWL